MATSPSSEIEVIKDTGLIERHKATGPDRLSPSFFKDGEINLSSRENP